MPSSGMKRTLDISAKEVQLEQDEEENEEEEKESEDNPHCLQAEWTETEEAAFLHGLKTHEHNWGAVQQLVGVC